MSAGIDYGFGRTNINHETGIRFGVISQHSISQAWADSSESDYGDPACQKCGGTVVEFDVEKHGDYECEQHACSDFACENCEHVFDSSDVYGDEALGYNYEGDGYKMTDCLDSDVMIIESLFFTYAPYCSPCVPGAGNLDSEHEYDESDGVKTYCVGHDWFEDGRAPYKVYSVETGALVAP